MALADTPDGGVAAHLPERIQPVRHQKGAHAHARCRERGFRARMTAADNDDFGIFHGPIISGTVAPMYKPLLKAALLVSLPVLVAASWQPALAAPPAVPVAQAAPGISLKDCRLSSQQSPTTVAARCGTFEVPEDYAHPEGKRLKLAIAVLPALDRGAKLAPVFLKNKYMLGDDFSMLDVAIAPLLWRLDHYGIQLGKQAAPLMKYAERLFSRPAYIDALTASEKVMRK
jgi:hypothetical protein